MAKLNDKWKKRLTIGLSLTLAATLSLGILSACKKTESEDEEEEEEEAAMPTDTQRIKNGNFEFFSEMTKEDKDEYRAVLNTPTSWSFTSGSPSSDTKSGLIDLNYWDYFTKAGRAFTSIDDAVAHWNDDDVTVYDRLKFYEDYKSEISDLTSKSTAKKLFDEYSYSVDYEDVQYLREEVGETVALHDSAMEEKGVLMIHNRRTSDSVLGTSQYYTSSTTITLEAGTMAEVSVWVKTLKLEHWYSDSEKTEVNDIGGAYIGVTQTVGGTTLDQMKIKNINTQRTNADGENNGWEKYTVRLRASTFATTTFKMVLGLGTGSYDDRYEAVNGYALFDDMTCKILPATQYDACVYDGECTVDDRGDDKLFTPTGANIYGIDLYNADSSALSSLSSNLSFALTEEKSGPSKVYTSEKIDASLYDNRGDSTVDEAKRNFADVTTLDGIASSSNGYVKSLAGSAFSSFPFGNEKDIVLLLTANGAAYTATLKDGAICSVPAETSVLFSFFVKTSEVASGKTGATITLVDGENKTTISAFDSNSVSTTDVGSAGEDGYKADIYDGWVQCFFFISNDTKEEKSYSIEFSLGPTSIVSSKKSDYAQGWAAFTNFEMKRLSKTEVSYASTGDRAKKVSLTGAVADTTSFDTPSAVSNIKEEIAIPSSFKGLLAGSNAIENNDVENKLPDGVYAGLVNSEYIDAYLDSTNDEWNGTLKTLANGETGAAAWKNIFGNEADVARQPLVIMNTTAQEQSAYGYMTKSLSVSSSTYQEISMRVKLSLNATASIYLIDTSDLKSGYNSALTLNTPKVTFWYDDNGNIVKSDPTAKDYKAQTGLLYTLLENGLYRSATDKSDTNYYANLYNYEKDGDNYVTEDGTVVFYGHDGKVYAYYNEEKDAYSTEVVCLPESALQYARYDLRTTAMPTSVITVDGAKANGGWVDVSFYVHTGSVAKSYRLEVWAGSRDNEKKLPAGGYVFFDRYNNASTSNYDALVKEAISNLKSEKGYTTDNDGNLVAQKADGTALDAIAYYYTFTFFDSLSYIRYDETTDDEGFNPYSDYKQSDYSKTLIALMYDNATQDSVSEYTMFLDYSAIDVTVKESDGSSDDSSSSTESNKIDTSTLLLVLSSALLAIVLIAVIVILLVRRILAKRRRNNYYVPPVKDNRFKPENTDNE